MKPKNIVLFVTDQWRWDTLNDPQSPAKLPNLQKFRAQSTNFTNAFTSVPLCTPARGSLFTGKWPHQTGTMDNVQGTSFYPHGKLHPDQTTYLERLQEQGYDVSFIGKWHLGAGTLLDRGIADAQLSDGGHPAIVENDAPIHFAEPKLPPYYGTVTEGTPMDEHRVRLGMDRLERYAKSDKPFCLVVSLHGPHFPHFVPQEWVSLYEDLPQDYMPDNFIPQFTETGKPIAQGAHYWPYQDTRPPSQEDWRRTAQHYWGFCSYIDHLFGAFRDKMVELDMDHSCVTAFTADHGEMLGAHGWFDKGPFFYEEVMRIPMMMRVGDQSDSETRENFVSLKDLFATVIDAAGTGDLLSAHEQAQSYYQSDNSYVTYGYDAYQGRQFKFRGLRNERYKYAWSPHDLAELYDLETDPQERSNRAGDPALAEVQSELHAQLFDWMRSQNDALAYDVPQLPVGSYIDGRPISAQHDHGHGRKPSGLGPAPNQST